MRGGPGGVGGRHARRARVVGEVLVDEPADAVVRLTISNPEKRNALDRAILDRLAELLPAIDARCAIITGTQGMFSSGYDIGEIPDDVFAEEAEKLVAHPFTAAIRALDEAPYATVAALSGHAIGGGLELAVSCDLRIARDGIRLGMPPAKLGLVYSHTGLRRFLSAIGEPRTRELFLLGRTIEARTALAWGLVNDVVGEHELAEAALDVAVELASNAPLSIAGNKRVLRELLAASAALDPDVERELIALRRACFASEDLREGVRAFAEKRPARWKGR
ncbi:MAG: enoyl-CoA hydratase/isomerase family protein [Solirubrobacteraceae bacterium]|nr:enoyl-CoA hydratase/isomerase family protein [Solirubrobacteraceae bacterium]